jgi:CelD/BcsL family acetyltransferase involved in cellulose biosynthesis
MTWHRWDLAAAAGDTAAWERLAQTGEFPAVSGPAWTAAFLRAFLPDGERAALDVLDVGGALGAVLPLRRTAGVFRQCAAVENEHNPYASLAIDLDRPGVVPAVLDHLLASSDYLQLGRLHEDGRLVAALREAALARGSRAVVTRNDHGDALIRLGTGWGESRRQLSRNILRDLPRKTRKMERAGAVDFERLTGGPALLPALDECLDLETQGWKGVSGSPILASPRTRRFYTDLAAGAAATGGFALYLLRHRGRLVAFEYCLRSGGRIDMLKLSYAPDASEFSPGGVLRLMILEREAAEGAVRSYHLGRPSDWKMRWATDVRPLCTVRIYGRGLRARAAHAWTVEARRAAKTVASALRAKRAGAGAPQASAAEVAR